MASPRTIWICSQARIRSVVRRASLNSPSAICVSKAASSTTVPGRERVTTLRQSSTTCIASRSTRPTAWLRKCVVAKVNSTRPEAILRRCVRLPRSKMCI